MSKAIDFLELNAWDEQIEGGDIIQNVSLNDAIHATNLARIEALEWVKRTQAKEYASASLEARIQELKKITHSK